jgi:hypothetical protein
MMLKSHETSQEGAQVLLGLSRQGAMGVPEGTFPDLSAAWAPPCACFARHTKCFFTLAHTLL